MVFCIICVVEQEVRYSFQGKSKQAASPDDSSLSLSLFLSFTENGNVYLPTVNITCTKVFDVYVVAAAPVL